MNLRFGTMRRDLKTPNQRLTRKLAVLPAVGLMVLGMQAAAAEGASEWQDGEKANVRLISATTGVGDLETLRLGLEVELQQGWKTYWRSPGDAGIPPHLVWDGSENVGEIDFQYPAPVRFDYYGLDTFGYEDRVVYPIEITPAVVGEAVDLQAQVNLLICDDVCIPHTMDVDFSIPGGPAGPSDHGNLLDRFANLVPGDGSLAGLNLVSTSLSGPAETPTLEVAFAADEPFVAPDLLVEGPDTVLFHRPEAELSAGGMEVRFLVSAEDVFGDPVPVDVTSEPLVVTLVDGARAMEAAITPQFGGGGAAAVGGLTLLTILGLALVGGLVLNLMPCVLPVLSIKMLAVVGHGGDDPKRVRLGFLATTAGIISAFLVLASGLVILKAVGLSVGWGIQFQQPLFIVTMVLILTLFACNMWGMFEIRLPGKVSDVAATAGGGGSGGDSMKGHFFSGAFATLLATPCSAPFLGTAVGFALSRGVFDIYAVFAALGIGMAAPFVAVALFPQVATMLPKPGNWMLTLKKVLSFTLVATAIWLLTVLAVQVSILAAVVVAGLMVAITALIALRPRMPEGYARPALAAGVVAAVLSFAAPSVLPEGTADASPSAGDTVAWAPFEPDAIAQYVADGKVVFVDVTAEWCITCKVNKKRVLDTETVAAVLNSPDVIPMKADWTKPNDEIAQYLASFGRFGIPFNIVYGPDSRGGEVLPELLSMDSVAEGFGAADTAIAVAFN